MSLGTEDLTEAIRRANELRERPVTSERGTLKADAARYFEHKQSLQAYTKASLKSKTAILNAFVRFAENCHTASVDKPLVERWYRYLIERIAVSTANSYLVVVKTFFNWAIEKRIVARNSCNGIELVRAQRVAADEFCSREEVARLIDNCTNRDLLFVLYMGFHAGMRTQEILHAKASWIDMAAGLIHIRQGHGFMTKSKKERTIPMTPQMKAFLVSYPMSEPFLLRPEKTEWSGLERFNFTWAFKTYVASQDLPWVTPKVMRHTFGSLLVSAGVSVYKVSRWMGHSSVVVTEKHYARLLPNDGEISKLMG